MTLKQENSIGFDPILWSPKAPHITWRTVTQGWPGSGYKSQTTEARIRRVNRHVPGAECDQLQFELQVRTDHETRTATTHAALVLNNEDIDTLLAHISPKAQAALRFVEDIARFTRDGETEPVDGKRWNAEAEDALDTVDAVIRKAREILGLPEHPDDYDPEAEADDGTNGQDRKSYSDSQDRKSYDVDPDLADLR